MKTKAALPEIEWALIHTVGKLHNVNVTLTDGWVKISGNDVEVMVVATEDGFLVASTEYNQKYTADQLTELLLGSYTLYTQLVFMKTLASLKERKA